jgi:TonB family protein
VRRHDATVVPVDATAAALALRPASASTLAIAETGCAKRVEIARSVGYPPLDAAALAWAEGLRFHPLLVDGKPTTSWHTFAVTFKLSE